MKAALIGLGMVAETHVRALADAAPDVTLAGICGRSADKTKAYADQVASILEATPKVYADSKSVADDPTVDFVIICTPPNARLALVRQFAQAGKPILMEKPIERTLAAASEIVETCEQASVPLGIVFQHRMRDSAQLLAQKLREGAFGQVALAEINVPWWREQAYYDEPSRGTYARDGGGVLISQAIHTLDLALSLLGPATKVQAMAHTTALHTMEAEDFVTAGVQFANGSAGSIVASTASFPGAAESITLHCTKASVTLVSGQLEISWRDGQHDVIGKAGGTGGGADPMAFTHAWHQGIITDFADAIRTGRPPVADGRTALQVHQLIDAIVTSSREERAVTLSESST